jgi:hypothetical protein
MGHRPRCRPWQQRQLAENPVIPGGAHGSRLGWALGRDAFHGAGAADHRPDRLQGCFGQASGAQRDLTHLIVTGAWYVWPVSVNDFDNYNGPVTVTGLFPVAASRQDELVDAINETGEVMRRLPGFLGSSVFASLDGTRVINYSQ